jgi:hypothetical protein
MANAILATFNSVIIQMAEYSHKAGSDKKL